MLARLIRTKIHMQISTLQQISVSNSWIVFFAAWSSLPLRDGRARTQPFRRHCPWGSNLESETAAETGPVVVDPEDDDESERIIGCRSPVPARFVHRLAEPEPNNER